jgi:hypothetical protein
VINLDGWIPTGIEWAGSHPAAVEWCFLGGMQFTEPFFEATVQRAMENPFRMLFRPQLPVEVLEERAVTHPGIAPTGFIFHMSRCGSTLITQMLAASNENVVVSEGWPIESAIGYDLRRPEVSEEQRRRLLRGIIHALGQPRIGTERRYFVKFDAIHTIYLPLVRSAFPEVPWVFVYRDPLEVMVSQLMKAAAWSLPEMAHKISLPAASSASREEYLADLIVALCEAGLKSAQESRGMLINYTELPNTIYSDLAEHYHCTWSDEERGRMFRAATRDAKYPDRPFSADSETKRRQAEHRVRELCAGKLGDVYSRLEAARAAMRQI